MREPNTPEIEERAKELESFEDPRDAQECEVCGTKMFGLHCKVVCPNCGYKRDCSDP